MRINPQAPGQQVGGVGSTDKVISQFVQCLLINTVKPVNLFMNSHRAVARKPPEVGLEQARVRFRMAR